ncbi:MAG: hypothetical protein PHY42_03045 [Bacilli bacterium]|nr:hypothetical protein [Bacilli bacterium]
MEYFNEDEILRYFQKEIGEVSKRQIKKLQSEIDTIKTKELERIEKEVKSEINATLGRDLEELQIKHRQTIHEIKTTTRRDLINFREDLLELVLTEVIKKVQAFVKSEHYLALMRQKLTSISFGKQALFHISKKDQGLKTFLHENYHEYPVKEDDNINLGGFLVELIDLGTTLDETIDHKLAIKKQWFYEHSHLFLEE